MAADPDDEDDEGFEDNDVGYEELYHLENDMDCGKDEEDQHNNHDKHSGRDTRRTRRRERLINQLEIWRIR